MSDVFISYSRCDIDFFRYPFDDQLTTPSVPLWLSI